MERRDFVILILALVLECTLFAMLGLWWVSVASVVLVMVVLLVAQRHRLRRRVRRHVCARCGYHIGTLRRCPECGWNAWSSTRRVAQRARMNAMLRGER